MSFKNFLHKLTHWEYWPYQIVYFPIYFQYFYYGIRLRSFFFFNVVNPGFKNGGFFTTSKKEIYDCIPEKYYPKTFFFEYKTEVSKVLNTIKNEGLNFPLILKPDIGLRGIGVHKIETVEELKTIISKVKYNFLIQELIPYTNEIGLFYVKLPNTDKGRITGIVSKEFFAITGDGKQTIKELIKKTPRFALQLKELEKNEKIKLDTILKKGELKILVPFGNHCRGAKFIDKSEIINSKLTDSFNSICNQIKGFNYGRMDIMYENIEDLQQGKKFQIIEINGVISEPTHIYDPKHSLFFGWKELIRHYGFMYTIALDNKNKGYSFLSFSEGKKELRKHKNNLKKLQN